MLRLQSFCHHAADPCFNMAFDETMLEQVAVAPDSVLIRLYTWQPAAITIGVNQQVVRAVRQDLLDGTPLLRRITGGRAVYHDVGELTYAIALNLDNPDLADWQSSVQTVYLRLAEGLRLFLERLGRSAQIVRRSPEGRTERSDHITAPCFESSARYELTAGGGKVLASAQRQAGPAILQHGSIKLHGLVGHPALPATGTDAGVASQPIEPERFEQIFTQYVETFLDWWGVAATGHTTHGHSLVGLEERLAIIRRDPLSRRNPLERYSR